MSERERIVDPEPEECRYYVERVDGGSWVVLDRWGRGLDGSPKLVEMTSDGARAQTVCWQLEHENAVKNR